MKKFLVVTSKVVLFALITIWILGFLATILAILPGYADYLETEGLEDDGIMLDIMIAWFLITGILVAVWAALKGFMTVGKWESEKEEDEEEITD